MKKILFVFLIGLPAIFSSCEKVLDKKPLDMRSEDDVWSDVKLAQAYLNRIWYAVNRTDFNYESWFGLYAGPLTPGSEVTTDNCYSRWNRGTPTIKSGSGVVDATANFGAFDNFGDLRRINIAIDHLTDPSAKTRFGEDVTNDMLGQAYFAKGLIYYTRAKVFGGYPIIDKTLAPEDDLSLHRASLKETYDYAIQLLEKSIPLLNKTAPAGRPGKGAAYALLSETCLLAAAYIDYERINGAASVDLTPYYNKVIKTVEDIDALGMYTLETQSNFSKMFNDLNYASGSPAEIILAQFTPPNLYRLSNDKQVEMNCYLPYFMDDALTDDVRARYNNKPFAGFVINGGWLTIAPNPKAVDEAFYIIDLDGKARRWLDSQLFAKYVTVNAGIYTLNAQAVADGITDIARLMYDNIRDKRFYATIAYDGCTYFNNKCDARVGGNMHPRSYKTIGAANGFLTGYVFRKSVPETQAWTTSDYSGFYKICLRLSKAYLNAAEAYMLKGDDANARGYINKTRVAHGGLPALTNESGDELWRIYIDERNAELMLENDRYYTLMRYGIRNGAEIIDELNFGEIKQLDIAADGKSYTYVNLVAEGTNNDFHFARHRYLFPVPKSVTDMNPNYLPNNPRY